eukprot:TRINITY_DN39618_c0_g1_i1.p1 TRINITY_DN39618_c0_g1~~TRINITY_DN39618_c0_g1_i1.p1  ORF type:complete len:580 (+),score=144.15 TRINITY_DN39618_c0_g1_i1:61-1740(+)
MPDGPDLTEQEFGVLCEGFAARCSDAETLPADGRAPNLVGEILTAAGLGACAESVSSRLPAGGSYDEFMTVVRDEKAKWWTLAHGGQDALDDVSFAWAELGGGDDMTGSVPVEAMERRAEELGLPASALGPQHGDDGLVLFADFVSIVAQRSGGDDDDTRRTKLASDKRYGAQQLPFRVMLHSVRPGAVQPSDGQSDASKSLTDLYAQLRREHLKAISRSNTFRNGRSGKWGGGNSTIASVAQQLGLMQTEAQTESQTEHRRQRAGSEVATDVCPLLPSSQQALRADVEAFLAGDSCQLSLPSTLTQAERNFVHDWCTEHAPDCTHVSAGEWPLRTVVLTKNKLPPARQVALTRETEQFVLSSRPEHTFAAPFTAVERAHVAHWLSEHAAHVKHTTVGDWPDRTLTLSKRGAAHSSPDEWRKGEQAPTRAAERGPLKRRALPKVPAQTPAPQWVVVRERAQRLVLRRAPQPGAVARRRLTNRAPIGFNSKGGLGGAARLLRKPAGPGDGALPPALQMAALAALWGRKDHPMHLQPLPQPPVARVREPPPAAPNRRLPPL